MRQQRILLQFLKRNVRVIVIHELPPWRKELSVLGQNQADYCSLYSPGTGVGEQQYGKQARRDERRRSALAILSSVIPGAQCVPDRSSSRGRPGCANLAAPQPTGCSWSYAGIVNLRKASQSLAGVEQ